MEAYQLSLSRRLVNCRDKLAQLIQCGHDVGAELRYVHGDQCLITQISGSAKPRREGASTPCDPAPYPAAIRESAGTTSVLGAKFYSDSRQMRGAVERCPSCAAFLQIFCTQDLKRAIFKINIRNQNQGRLLLGYTRFIASC